MSNYGVYLSVDGTTRRAKSKKEVKEVAERDPSLVYLESTSEHFGNPSLYADRLEEGQKLNFVGPDPYTSRKFYGTITLRDGKVKVS